MIISLKNNNYTYSSLTLRLECTHYINQVQLFQNDALLLVIWPITGTLTLHLHKN
jgi:hypothetical protein